MSDSVELSLCLWCQAGETEFKNNQHWVGTRYHVNSVDLIHWCGDGSVVMPRRRIVITAKTREECIAAWNTRATDPLLDEMAEALARYRNETPLGHQPHMIAHKVDELLQKYHEQKGRK